MDERAAVLIEGARLADARGRTLLLRGMNLGAGSKLPSRPDGATHRREAFFDHRQVSFVGRPLPLADADDHLRRLASWGFSHVRLLVTWEAVEHAGPGIYDREFLDYLAELVRRIDERRMTVHMDPHQDAWSRFTGGSGAPGWTLEAVGMDPARVHETGAAFLHQVHGDPLPRMIWPTNGAKLAAATMFTVFFGGNVFAPRLSIEGEPAQDFLQNRYCDAMAQVARHLRAFPCVAGWETMNEPLHGWIGHRDLAVLEGPLRIDASPSPFQSMLLASGFPREVPVYDLRATGPARTGTRRLNPGGVTLWKDGMECVWRRHGVWDIDGSGQPRLLRPDYFAAVDGRAADFATDFYRPFANRFAGAIRAVDAKAAIFVQVEIGMKPPAWGPLDARRIVYAPHWYDTFTLMLKRFLPVVAYDSLRRRLVVGPRAVVRGVASQLTFLRDQAHSLLGGAPVVIGETGVPFDLRNRSRRGGGGLRGGGLRGGGRSGGGLRGARIRAVDRIMRGVESSLVSVCWWNYTPDNTVEHGDGWNGEDFSIFSRNDADGGPEGGRALESLVRPYPRAVAGDPLSLRFDRRSGAFAFSFQKRAGATGPTEIFVPGLQYPDGCTVTVSDGVFRLDEEAQLLTWEPSEDRDVHTIRIRRRG